MGSNNEENDNASFQMAMQLIDSSVLPIVLKSVIELDLLEIIARAGPGAYVSSSELVAQLPTKDPAAAAAVTLDRILGLLTSYSVLSCKLKEVPGGRVERLYALAPICKFLIKNEDGVSLAPFLLMNYDKIFMESWYHVKDAVLEGGIPFNRAHGMSLFDYMGIDSSVNKLFNDVMIHGSTLTMKKILEIYKGFEAINGTLVDVGGGTGTTLNMIVSKYPTIKGVNFDMPQVIKNAPSYPGVEHVGGDMFVNVPKGDVIFMKWICHNWSDEHCLKFLKNCYDSLPINGKMIVVDFIVPTVHDTSMVSKNMAKMDVRMFTYHGGKERTLGEFEALARGAGFQGFNLICPAFITYIMEFYKNNV